MSNDTSTNRVPAGVPTGGQFAASAKSEAGVTLDTGAVVGPDFAERFRAEVVDIDDRWRNEADTEGVFNGLILALAKRVRDASEDDRPRYARLDEATDALAEMMADKDVSDGTVDDQAEEVLFCLEDITDPHNMDVVFDGPSGQYLRVADGQPGHACPDCGAGYATASVLAVHQDTACDGADDDDDDTAHDALHSAAESFASDINNAGRAEQVAFLRRTGHNDTDILATIAEDPNEPDLALGDLVIDAASQFASRAYNNGETDGAKVTERLESQRWLLSGDRTLTTKHPMNLEPGECTDVTFRDADGTTVTYRVSYAEWVPNGDDNTPARGYRRGEFSSESEWGAHEYVVARESSPFRPAKGERGQMVGYAWERYSDDLTAAAKKSIAAKRNDPLRPFIDGTDSRKD